ncbi:MAG: molybdate ABC transporter substrate-binding protein [Actinomycetota bacterium]|nr:molybdate ABC transporter substrate-binding protein [Actinomycetota bacterium]
MNRRTSAIAAALLGTAVLATSCGSSDNATTGSSVATGSPATLAGTITVLAASSLRRPFDALATLFQRAHPGTTVKVSYDGSSTLVTQITGGAPADVFASADQKNMSTVTDAGLAAGTPTLFASNTLQIAVAPGNPKKISSLADLAKSGVVTVLCAPAVPCGRASHTALDAAKVTVRPASEEQNVTAVLTKVESGDANAGLVYVTDILSAGGKVLGVNFPEASKAVNRYPIVALKAAPNAAGAKAFVDLVLGPDGQKTLAGLGFARP